MECPYCNAENRDGVRFCNSCGKPLNPASAASSGSGSGNVNSRSLTPGSRVQGGRYVIKKVLGQGGMGAALLATDIRLDSKAVVIKELISDNTDPTQLQEDVRNFKREVATLAHIDHPLVPNVTDHFQEGTRYFMVQEYVEGENLEERMDRVNQPMKEREALGYASEVLDILDYLAQQTPPIVHRDIKPANIIISTKDKRAHLVDFGIARAEVARNAKRKQTSALGTPGYAPPEQYQGNADPRSDLYALAATLHHLLTNRDPRNHPPFTYPPVRTLNPQLSADVERVLSRALINDINQRYQSAAAMKRDIDEILLHRFGVSGNTTSYTLGTSGPIGTIAASAANAPTIAQQPTQVQQRPRQAAPAPAPAAGGWQGTPYQPISMVNRQQQPHRSNTGRNFILLVLVVFLIAAVLFFARSRLGNTGSTPTPTFAPVTSNGIGATKAPDGELIGVSDGTVAFDIGRADGNLKAQAAAKLKAGDVGSAEALWSQAIAGDSNDAELLIYQEDQRVLSSGNPYITIVVGSMLTGASSSVGRDDLEGAFVAQKEFNDGFKLPNSVQVRLLVANSGNQSAYAATVAQQIVQAAQADKTIVGVMGWPFSSRALDAIGALAAAHIPMVSQTASSDLLTNKSLYFFRVAPANLDQGIAGALYVEQKLLAKKVAVFVDPADAYSSSLAQDFSKQFIGDGNGDTIVVTEHYTVGKPSELPALLQDALSHNPDLIYFSGYASDAGTLLTDLPTSGPAVMGGDALYELGGYPSSARPNFNKLRFTAFAHPDEWVNQGLAQPAFFTEYPQAFDPARQHVSNPYGYVRPDSDVILSYDAMLALLGASKNALSGGQKSLTPDALQQALTKITGAQTIQGLSGQISFGPDGNPIKKAFVILKVTPQDTIGFESVQGCFLIGSSC